MNLEKLLTKTGTINSAIIRRDKFKQSEEYKFIFENSHDLDIFDNVSFADRFWYIYDKMHLTPCVVCGKPRILFKRTQNRYNSCPHKQNIEGYKGCKKRSMIFLKKRFIDSIEHNKTPILTEEEFLNHIEKLKIKKENYAFMISKKYFKFYHDLVIKTKNIIPFDENDYKMSERFYLASNNLKEKPKCKFCGKETIFLNRFAGYKENCNDCVVDKIDEAVEKRNFEFITRNFNYEKYELLKIPKIVTKDPLIIKCKKCGKISEIYLINGRLKNLKNLWLCKYCEGTCHFKEYQLYEFIKGIYDGKIIYQKDSRKIIPPQELDIYLPEKKLAFEFDGTYWHIEDNGKPKNYHIDKTNKCLEKGIQLIHIFESEWDQKQDIVKSRIKNLLGNYDNTCYARQCEIREISSKESYDFQDMNHIQGAINSRVNVGLFFKNELVSLMTFSKPRFNKNYEWELVRFCNKLGWHIPGAASKLLTYFEKTYKPMSILSYADRRWSVGNLYEKLGFSLKTISPPNYWYVNVNTKEISSRIKFQKHKLKNILKHFYPEKSESENMEMNGYSKIYDCGNYTYVKIL